MVTRHGSAPGSGTGTGLARGSTFGESVGGYGIEIDHDRRPTRRPGRPSSPRSPTCSAPGLTAQMTYYETTNGAKVFAAGALDFGGSASTWPVSRILENLWARLSLP